uniref:Uncharacterized protein n=1 Tax=Arion vulgaris TaxID=1028688 RepID=A0A0B7BY07_9EUPU
MVMRDHMVGGHELMSFSESYHHLGHDDSFSVCAYNSEARRNPNFQKQGDNGGDVYEPVEAGVGQELDGV